MFYNLLIESQLCGPVCWVLALTCVFPLRIWPFIYSLALTLFFGYNSSNLFPWNPLAWFCVFGFILKERKISKGGWVRWKSFSWDPGSDKVFILSSLKVFFFSLLFLLRKIWQSFTMASLLSLSRLFVWLFVFPDLHCEKHIGFLGGKTEKLCGS